MRDCSPTDFRWVYEERERTDKTRKVVSHVNEPNDLVLNKAQMRDAVHVQRFRIDSDLLDADTITHASSINEVNLRKVADAEMVTASSAVANSGRGKGRARTGMVSRTQTRSAANRLAVQQGEGSNTF